MTVQDRLIQVLSGRFEGGWHLMDYPEGSLLKDIFNKQVEEYKTGKGKGLDADLQDLLKEALVQKLGTDYDPETRKMTAPRLKTILEKTLLKIFKPEASAKAGHLQYDISDKAHVRAVFNKIFDDEQEQATTNHLGAV